MIIRLTKKREGGGPLPGGTHNHPVARGRMRSALAIAAVVVACGSYFVGASVTPSASGDIGSQVGFSKAQGIDSCEYPSNAALKGVWKNFQFAYLGIYIGGRTPCRGLFTKGKVNRLHAIGYDFLLIMDGRQPPCSKESTDPSLHFSANPAEGYREAREEAAAEVNLAVKRMKELGFTTPGSIVYYDFESFDQAATPNPNCLAAAKQFINNWDRRLKEAYGAKSGFYGPTVGAHVKEFWGLEYPPDAVWFSETQAEGKGRLAINAKWKSVWAVPNEREPKNRLPADHWPERRVHQWEKEQNLIIPVGGKEVKYPLDFNCAMGKVVAGSGEKKEQQKCLTKGLPE
jgi:hypothetical protein